MTTMKKTTMNKWALLSLLLFAALRISAQPRWSVEKAQEWSREHGWVCGVNYIPAGAVNYTAMWDKTSFSPKEIRRELGLMKDLGMNCVRFVMQYKVYEDDPKYFVRTLGKFLRLCDEAGVKAMPIFFDDCTFGTNNDPHTGRQPEPLRGWYAWGWSPSPGLTAKIDYRCRPMLERYVKDVMTKFRDDERILLWDLYNEPTNCAMSEYSWTLLRDVFRWAREVNPSQPISSGLWNGDAELNEFLLTGSDVVTFHHYGDAESTLGQIEEKLSYGRPVICTEWMNRVADSTIKDNLHLFAEHGVGCLLWGLVNGKTQTDLPWGHRPEMLPYKGVWQHDIFRGDLTPYDPEEIELLRSTIAASHSAK